MGGLCNTAQTAPSFPSQNSSDDPTLALPNFDAMKSLINRKSGELDINITWSARKTSSNTDLSLILPASKNSSHSLIIRYYLLYSFHISKYNEKSFDKMKFQTLFFTLMDQSCTQKEEKDLLTSLKKQYQALKTKESQLYLLLLNYTFKSNFILQNLNKVLLSSNDLKALTYFIFPIYALHSAIFSNFKRPDNARKENIWIVAVLQDREIKLLKQLEGTQNYFFFSAFMRGFTDKNCANEAFKNLRKQNKKNTFLFTVNFPYDPSKLSTQQNKGFFICKDASSQIKKKGDVIFNIMASFKLSSKADSFEYDIDYGQLARLYYQKEKDRFPGKQPVLLKIYELCRGVSKFYLKSQSCLFRIIGGKEQGLRVSNTIMKSSIANDIQRENIINTHMQNGQFDKALQNVGDSQNLLLKAKKIQILYEKALLEEAKTEIAKIKGSELKQKKNFQSRLIIDLISARIEMKNNQFKKAQDRLKELYAAVEQTHPNDFEYIGRDVVSALVECERKGCPQSGLDKTVSEGAGGYNAIAGNNLSLSSISIKAK